MTIDLECRVSVEEIEAPKACGVEVVAVTVITSIPSQVPPTIFCDAGGLATFLPRFTSEVDLKNWKAVDSTVLAPIATNTKLDSF